MSPLRLSLILGVLTLAGSAAADPPAAVADPAPVATGDDAVSPARHALAVAANTQGLHLYRANQLPRAALRFHDATLLDPGYVLAHYNLACMASRLRDVGTVVAELAWLRGSSNPVAAAKLDKGLADPDSDFASSLPTVRTILGLAPLDPRAPLAWLGERRGTWSAELPTDDCSVRSYTFAFDPSGGLLLTVREACGHKPLRTHTFDGSAVVDTDSVHVSVQKWPLWPDGVKLTFAACPGLVDAPGSCFTLATADGNEIGPFHRGVPGANAMRARRTVATATH